MSYVKKATAVKLLHVIGMVLIIKGLIYGQSLDSKLLQKASFVPTSTSAVDQLIEVAQHYDIPMGIEWIDRPDARVLTLPQSKGATVQGLITAILRQSPGYQLKLTHGIVHIANRAFVDDPKNFLNLRIREFKVKEANVFDANASLRLNIKMTLHPARYAGGWNGGYGFAPGSVFDVRNITFSGRDLTVRQIINKIAAANSNALWVVRLDPSRMMRAEPAFFAQEYESEDFRWRIIPLVKTSQ